MAEDELRGEYNELTQKEVEIWDTNREEVIKIIARKREIIEELFKLKQS